MADYRIQIGTQLDTKGIDAGINKYHQKKTIEFKSKLDTSGIDNKITSYKSKKPIEINAKLNTSGLAKKISEYKPKTPVKLNAKLDTKNIDAAIRGYKAKKAIELNVKLNHSAISEQIRNYKAKTAIKLNTRLDNNEISNQIKNYQAKTPIKLGVKLTTKDIDEKIRAYKAKSPIKLDVKINNGTINEQIKNFVPKRTIQLKAALQKGVIAEEIRNFKSNTPIKVSLELDQSDIDNKISAYKSKPPVEIPAKLKLDVNDINSQLKKYKLTVPINLSVKQLDTKAISEKIKNYKTNVPISVGVKLDGKGINEQIASLPKITTPLNIGVKLDESKVNADIALFKPTATLGIQPDLIIENVEEQISTYVPKVPLKVNVQINNDNIDKKAAAKNLTPTIQVNVKLDREKINEQIRNFKTQTKIKIGVKLDANGISNQIKSINSKTPVKVNLKLDTTDAKRKINDIKNQIKELGNVKINIGRSAGGNAGGGSTANDIKLATNELKKIQLLAREIGKLDFKMNTLDTKANVNQIKELERQLELLKIQYYETAKTLSQSGVGDISSVTSKEFVNARNKLAEFDAKLEDTKAKLAKGITVNFGNYDADLLSLNNRFDKLAEKPQEVKIALDSVRMALEALKTADGTEDIIAKNERYKEVLNQVKAQLSNLEAIESGYNYQNRFAAEKEAAMKRLNSLFGEGSAAAKRYGEAAEQLRNELNSCGNVQGVQNVTKKINALGNEIKKSGIQTQKFTARLKEQFSKHFQYLFVASMFMYVRRAMRSMFEQVKLIDSAMTELKKVTNETDDSYNQFLSNAASRAKELGTTIDGLVSSTADFARLGYGFEDSQKLAEVANIYAVVGDEIEGVEDATQSLVSTLAAFKDEMNGMSDSDFAMSIVDKMNEVSNNFAISSGGIGEALQRSASSMAAANNTLDETIAMITAANEVAQNPEKVGNAMKTMSMRIRGAKTELEEAGESTDGMAESTASLRQEMLALSGVDIMLNENTFKSTYQIMDELSQKWEGLSDIAQATIIELVAGRLFARMCRNAHEEYI